MYTVRGAARAADALRRHWVRRGGEYWIDDFDGETRLRVDLAEHMASQIFWRGTYSGDELAVLAGRLSRDAAFVDVGANLGEFSLFAARRVARVYAFEPSADLFERLRQNVAANGWSHVTTVRSALSDRIGELTLSEPREAWMDGSRQAGLGSLFPYPDAVDVRRQSVPVTTLDAFVESERPARLDVIKIDVEGSELAVLRGAEAAVARFRPEFLIELNTESAVRAGHDVNDVLAWLATRRYRAFSVAAGGRLVPRVSADPHGFENVLFVPEERPCP
jgi:FkbM family methyltransferase